MMEKYQLDHSLDEYIKSLINYGVIVNKKLVPALFFLKNGLKYPGLLTNQKVDGQQELVRVPIQLLLTSNGALKDPELKDVFSDAFYKEDALWQENRILVTYILYLLSTDRNCIWTFMAKHFSKQIDILSFWDLKEIDFFVDPSVSKAVKKERNYFEKQFNYFQQIQEKYEILQDKKWFNRENYKWIYIHGISRCFGSFLNSSYFVPFCQLFNHNVVDVSYQCFKESQEKKQNEHVQTEHKASEDTYSISSVYSEDYLSDDDFDYLSINSYTIKWLSKISYDLKDKEVKIIDKKLKEIYDWMDKQLEWKGFTLIYLGQIIEKLKIIENQYKAGRKKFQESLEKAQEIKSHVYVYRKSLVEFYRSHGKQYQKVIERKREANSSNTHNSKPKEGPMINYTHFRMEARDEVNFAQNTQIYFCYGKLSNRNLLIRYGFCLENNPYEHVWIKFSMRKYIEPYPDLFEKIQEKGLSVNYKIKCKSYSFAMEPILLMRATKWKLTHHKVENIFFATEIQHELQYVQTIKQIYLKYLLSYININEDLTDSSIGYHQYFSRVYNKDKKKIVKYQIALIDEITSILTKLKQKIISLKQLFDGELNLQYKKDLRFYVKSLRGLMIQ